MRKLKLLLLLTPLLLSACNFSSTYLNREEDKADAESVANTYFNFIEGQNFSATYPLFSKKFWAVVTKDKIQQIMQATEKKLGKLENTALSHWETRIIKGTNPSSEYLLEYTNHYHNADAKETLRLLKDDDGKIRIVYYNIQSDGFFK